VLVQACLNGARDPGEHPAIPRDPAGFGRDAAACAAAGARSFHLHPRDGAGAESLDADVIGAAVAAVRAAAPGVPVGVSTGLWICDGDPDLRARLVSAWALRPDMASVNVREPGWRALCAQLGDLGVAVEIGLGTAEDAERFAAAGIAARCVRALVEPSDREPAAAVARAAAIAAVLDDAVPALPQLHHGFGAATWAVLDAAAPAGRDVRIGFEDTLEDAAGERAPANAALVAATVARYGAG
jgi:uncharacterized protein (DUF849 family)